MIDKRCLRHSGIKNQYKSSMCGAFATSTAMECLFSMVYDRQLELSPLYVYKESKEDDNNEALGTNLTNNFDEVERDGICEDVYFPLSADDKLNDLVFPPTPDEARDNAKLYKDIEYYKTTNLDDILEAIDKGYGVAIAMRVYDNYFDDYKGFMVRPVDGTLPIGGHAVANVGYDKAHKQVINGELYKGFLIIAESHGVTPSDVSKGYKFMAFDAIENKGKWKGLYSNDSMFQYAMIAKPKKGVEVTNPGFHDGYDIEIPRTDIELNIGSDVAIINGNEIKMECPPKVVDGRSLVGLRFLLESCLGYRVSYYPESKRVYAVNDNLNQYIELYVGGDSIEVKTIVDNKVVTKKVMLDVPAQTFDGRVFIPLRSISEVTGMSVEYDKGKIKIAGMI